MFKKITLFTILYLLISTVLYLNWEHFRELTFHGFKPSSLKQNSENHITTNSYSDEFKDKQNKNSNLQATASRLDLAKLRGKSFFLQNDLSDGAVNSVNPVYVFEDSELMVTGEGVPRPLLALRGGRGEIIFEMLGGKPITNRTISELYFVDDQLVREPRLTLSYHRANRAFFILPDSEQNRVEKIGIAFIAQTPFQNAHTEDKDIIDIEHLIDFYRVELVQEGLILTSEIVNGLPAIQFSPSWLAFDASGNEFELSNELVKVLWFSFDSKSGKLFLSDD